MFRQKTYYAQSLYSNRRIWGFGDFEPEEISFKVSEDLISASINTLSPHASVYFQFYTWVYIFREKTRTFAIKMQSVSIDWHWHFCSDGCYRNKGTVIFNFFFFFFGVINHVLAVEVFSINDTRKSNFDAVFFISFFGHTYKFLNFYII